MALIIVYRKTKIKSIFTFCEFRCPGCFNQEIWDFNVGKTFTREVYDIAPNKLNELLEEMRSDKESLKL